MNEMWIIKPPAAYQNGPAMPYLYATFADCSSVAAHVHLDTISVAVSPILMDRPADMKCCKNNS